MKNISLGLVSALVFSACATPSQVLVRKDGSTIRCHSEGIGVIGAPAALIAQGSCISDYRALGYIPIEEHNAAKANKNQPSISESITPPLFQQTSTTPQSAQSDSLGSSPSSAKSKDGSYIFNIPRGWTQIPPPANFQNSPGVIHAKNPSMDLMVLISTAENSDIQDFHAYAEFKRSEQAKKLTNPKIFDIQQQKINGLEAFRYEVTGLVNGVNIHYLVTIMQSEKKIIMVNAWTVESKFNRNRNELERLAFETVISNS